MLTPDEVHIHVLRMSPGDSRDSTEDFLPFLSPAEQQRYGNFSLESRRKEFLWSRLLLRWTLACCSGKNGRDLDFGFGGHGKPYLKNIPLEFNLTHTQGWVACAVSRRKLGVDIESLESPGWDNRPWRLLAGRYFTNPEKDYLFSLPETDQPTAFLRIFTLKEAAVKTDGKGLAVGLASFSIPLPLQEQSAFGPIEYFTKTLGANQACLALAVENPDRAALAYQFREWRQEEFKGMLQNPFPDLQAVEFAGSAG